MQRFGGLGNQLVDVPAVGLGQLIDALPDFAPFFAGGCE
jgi:hypothetical protein